MSLDFFKKCENKKIAYAYGGIIGFFISLAFMLMFALIILIFNIDRAYTVPFSTISIAIGSFTASKITSKKIGNKGYLTGIIIGGIVFALLTILSLVCGNSLSVNTLFRFIIIMLSSIVGGIMGVNTWKKKKYI